VSNATTTHQVAKMFADILVSQIGPKDMAKVNERNKAYADRDCCASHEFCDANMYMLEAIEIVTKKTDDEIIEALRREDLEILGLWRDAWDEAIKSKFWLKTH
jgi:hypothetical protein